MKHEWKPLPTPDDDRPHFRCEVCRKLCIARWDDEQQIEQAYAMAGPCLGAFVMPPHDSIQYKARFSRWIAAKMPTRDAETITRIWTSCCEPCQQRGGENVCGACACRVLPHGPAECNLIAMATEKCPLGKWA